MKLECLNPGRSFKIRGATNSLLSQEHLPELVMTASGGNHGLGVAIAAKRLEIPCKVVLPLSTSSYRVSLLKQLGAEVELRGEAWDEANNYALQQAKKSSSTLYIHPFADREVMIGQGTIWIETQKQLGGDIDGFVASVGGGGLLAGNALAMESMISRPMIVAVETQGADSLAQSLRLGKLTSLEHITSIAKTLGAKTTTPYIFETLQRLVDHMLVVSDTDAVTSIFQFLDKEKLLVEPATSCIISATLKNKELFRGKQVVLVICGSNVTYQEVLQWQQEFGINY